ncbi:lipid III flippase WzxE [Edwardsiella piscicida]|uniref:lipid III flippase WzxE n=1 Tax=Edwardsiella piscicida TaxID=1263550 RepID=UPI0002C1573A|nr:lipid III flippase WzxE [Edwardsiella piscicida]AGH72214.1 O-antigen translocase [Edwardsiella piscicida C07-087]EKS7780995.1 lipid III flippase WzxE [Edwardsiella piscicida]EKS7784224.1 lipid III flippase WzxE [Edwardsiella piscicida]UCQ24572.1 lipid III flippase WzxE [Edwardsiella piscicida]UCQ34709.1 lipid III flippase WzxE [Edwardsiella piscicida]
MSLARASLWTAGSTLIKIGAGLVVVKLLAVAFGPVGVGQAANFRQVITVLGVLSGAGIFNGITKYVAEYRQQPQRLRALLGTASTMILGFSLLLALIFTLGAAPISVALFGHDRYQSVIRLVALLQMGIACANYCLAVIKGYRDARGNALAVSLGSLLGVAAYTLSYFLGGYRGALAGLALVPAAATLPALWVLWRQRHIPWRYFRPSWDRPLAASLGKFTLMAVMTAVTMPVAYVMMRNQLAALDGWEAVGIWQGVSGISDAYLQFITASFSVYLLPTLAGLHSRQAVGQEILRALRFVLPAVAAVSFTVWLLRDLVIWLLLSGKFSAMRDLFAWQLTGDVFKVGAYVFGYLVIAKASLRFYLLCEISQFILLTLLSRILIPLHGALGAAQAYMATYIIYFLLCGSVFWIYRNRA